MNTHPLNSNNESLFCDEPQQQYIENANHHIDKMGGLHRGFDLEKWLAAEAKIDLLLAEK